MNTHGHEHGQGSGDAEPVALRDPVCGMSVTAASSHSAMYEGRPFFFCCNGCRSKFVADPVQLQGFIRSGLADLFQLESAIDATLAAFRGAR